VLSEHALYGAGCSGASIDRDGFLYQEQLDPARDHWRFSYENGRLARSIVEGRGFSSPLFEETARAPG